MTISVEKRWGGQFLDYGGAVFNPLHPDGGAVGDGTTNDRAAIAATDTDAQVVGGTIVFTPREGAAATYLVSTDLTITSPVRFESGAKIKPASGKTVTFAGDCHAGLFQVFDLSAGGSVVVSAPHDGWVKPQWWGATGDGVSSSTETAAVQAAIDSHNYVDLPGIFNVDGSIDAGGKTGLTFRGRSPFTSQIKGGEDGYPILDLTGTTFFRVEGAIGIRTDPGVSAPSCGVLCSRPTGDASSGWHKFAGLDVRGIFTICSVYSMASEANDFEDLFIQDQVDATVPSTATVGFIQAATPILSIASKFYTLGSGAGGNTTTVLRRPDIQILSTSADSRAMVLDGVAQFDMVSPYFLTNVSDYQIEFSSGAQGVRFLGSPRFESTTANVDSLYFSDAEDYQGVVIKGGVMNGVFGEDDAVLLDSEIAPEVLNSTTGVNVDKVRGSRIALKSQVQVKVRSTDADACYGNEFEHPTGDLILPATRYGNRISQGSGERVTDSALSFPTVSTRILTATGFVFPANGDTHVLCDTTAGVVTAKFVLGSLAAYAGQIIIVKRIAGANNATVATDAAPGVALATLSANGDFALVYINDVGTPSVLSTGSESATPHVNLNETHTAVFADCANGAISVGMPAAFKLQGRKFVARKTEGGGNNLTLNRAGSDTIDGGTSYSVTAAAPRAELMSAGGTAYFTTSIA